jgi:hypothetical protein
VSTREHNNAAKQKMNAMLIILEFSDIVLNKMYMKTRIMAIKQRIVACVQKPIPSLKRLLTYE